MALIVTSAYKDLHSTSVCKARLFFMAGCPRLQPSDFHGTRRRCIACLSMAHLLLGVQKTLSLASPLEMERWVYWLIPSKAHCAFFTLGEHLLFVITVHSAAGQWDGLGGSESARWESTTQYQKPAGMCGCLLIVNDHYQESSVVYLSLFFLVYCVLLPVF